MNAAAGDPTSSPTPPQPPESGPHPASLVPLDPQDVLEQLPEEQRPKVEALLFQASSFSSPLPPAWLMAEYEQIHPGAFDRILHMAENEQMHRHHMETTLLHDDLRLQARGLLFGFLLCMAAIIGGIVLIALGRDVAGMIAIIGALGGLAGVFIYAQRARRQQQTKEGEPEPASKP